MSKKEQNNQDNINPRLAQQKSNFGQQGFGIQGFGIQRFGQVRGGSQAVTQRRIQPRSSHFSSTPIQKKENDGGLPFPLQNSIEELSGYSMDDVRVHHNSDKPAQLHAHAYAQGTDIHLGPGQEKHLPHEAWHVVQQKQGRVQPTTQIKANSNINVNNNVGLEREADIMGAKASQFTTSANPGNLITNLAKTNNPAQLQANDSLQNGVKHITQLKTQKDVNNSLIRDESSNFNSHAVISLEDAVLNAYNKLRYYHGASESAVASIRQSGMNLNEKTKGATTAVLGENDDDANSIQERAKNYNYVTKSKAVAGKYAGWGKGPNEDGKIARVFTGGLSLEADTDSGEADEAYRTENDIPVEYVRQSGRSFSPEMIALLQKKLEELYPGQYAEATPDSIKKVLVDSASDSGDDSIGGSAEGSEYSRSSTEWESIQDDFDSQSVCSTESEFAPVPTSGYSDSDSNEHFDEEADL